MNARSIIDSVKDGVAEARSKAEMVTAHSQDVVKTGAQALRAARDVVAEGGREAKKLANRTKQELKQTLKDGAAQVRGKLMRIATPTSKEEAAARKLEVKAKKQRKRDDSFAEAESAAVG